MSHFTDDFDRLTDGERNAIERMRAYYPYRRIFLLIAQSGTREILCVTSRRAVNRLMRAGYQAWEIK